MKRIILIITIAFIGNAAMSAGDNGWRLGISANKSVMASGQAEIESPYWSLGGEVSYLWNPVWRLTVTPALDMQYLKYQSGDGGLAVTFGVDAGLKLGYGFSILTGPAGRYCSKSKIYIDGNDSGLSAYWGFGISKDLFGFYISAKYYQSITKGTPFLVGSLPGQSHSTYNEPRELCKNYFKFSIGYKF